MQWSSTQKKKQLQVADKPIKMTTSKVSDEPIKKITAKVGTQKHLKQVREARQQMNFNDKGQDFFSNMTSQSDASYSDDVFGSIEDEHCAMMTPISKTRDYTAM